MISIKVINELFDICHFFFTLTAHLNLDQPHFPHVTVTCGWWTLYWAAEPYKDSLQFVSV